MAAARNSGTRIQAGMTLLLILVAIAAGLANPFQSGTNAELNRQLGSPLWAGIVVYGSGFVALLLVQAVLRQPIPAHDRVSVVPVWAWFGGLISIVPTLVGLILAQRLGASIFTGLSVTAALACSIALDQFAAIGFRQHSASPARLAGCALMIAGLWIVSRT